MPSQYLLGLNGISATKTFCRPKGKKGTSCRWYVSHKSTKNPKHVGRSCQIHKIKASENCQLTLEYWSATSGKNVKSYLFSPKSKNLHSKSLASKMKFSGRSCCCGCRRRSCSQSSRIWSDSLEFEGKEVAWKCSRKSQVVMDLNWNEEVQEVPPLVISRPPSRYPLLPKSDSSVQAIKGYEYSIWPPHHTTVPDYSRKLGNGLKRLKKRFLPH